MSGAICSQKELAGEIRLLLANGREPPEQELRELQARLSKDLAGELPHFLWHWLADADIRGRDAEYGKLQAHQLESTLQQMEGKHAT